MSGDRGSMGIEEDPELRGAGSRSRQGAVGPWVQLRQGACGTMGSVKAGGLWDQGFS